MKKAKIRPLVTPKPLNRSSANLVCLIKSWTTFVLILINIYIDIDINNFGVWRCLAQLQTLIWKLLPAKHALQPSWQHLTRWLSICWTLIAFAPIAVESHGPIDRDTLQFLSELCEQLVDTTRNVRTPSFLFRRISVVVQRFNSVLLHICRLSLYTRSW